MKQLRNAMETELKDILEESGYTVEELLALYNTTVEEVVEGMDQTGMTAIELLENAQTLELDY